MVVLKTDGEIEIMSTAGKIAGQCLLLMQEMIKPGVKTGDLDQAAEEFIRKNGAIPSFKGYMGFPATLCVSPNSVVVHGAPGEVRLEEGDIVSIDVGATFNGYVGDTAATFPVGEVSPAAKKLLDVTRESLYRAVKVTVEGAHLGDIGYAIQSYVAKHGYSVVRDYAGHGVGQRLHEDPSVLNFGQPGTGLVLRRGMVIAIEPMVNIGGHEVITHKDMRVITKDGSLSAHFEHTVAVTGDGPRCLTLV